MQPSTGSEILASKPLAVSVIAEDKKSDEKPAEPVSEKKEESKVEPPKEVGINAFRQSSSNMQPEILTPMKKKQGALQKLKVHDSEEEEEV